MTSTEQTKSPRGKNKSASGTGSSNNTKYKMRLFIADNESNSVIAQRNINEICSEYLKGNYKLEFIDVFQEVNDAIEENIIVTPTLVIDKPKKVKIFGNLENKNKVLSALELI